MKDKTKLHFSYSDEQTLRALMEELDHSQKNLQDELVRHELRMN